jgi:hypothetical protein
MPAYDVTVKAVFENPTWQSAWQDAKALIETNNFTLTQKQAPDAATARKQLVEMINELIAPVTERSLHESGEAIHEQVPVRNASHTSNDGIQISLSDIVIYSFIPANGENGYFEFHVTPPQSLQSAYSSGTITASTVGNETVEPGSASLRAWTQDGILYVIGLTPGKVWRVYSATGKLVYSGIAVETRHAMSLQERGFYIIQSADRAVKIVN